MVTQGDRKPSLRREPGHVRAQYLVPMRTPLSVRDPLAWPAAARFYAIHPRPFTFVYTRHIRP
jgi:hypothetical protein